MHNNITFLDNSKVVKSFLLKIFYDTYQKPKDYFDRFFGVFLVFVIVSILAQSYSGYSEYSFFLLHAEHYKLPYPVISASIITLIFEIFKAIVTLKFFHEFLHREIKSFNFFFASLSLLCVFGSIYFSMNGIESRTIKNYAPTPIDHKTAKTDEIFTNNLNRIDQAINTITTRYTYKGTTHIPPNGNNWHSKKQAQIDLQKLNNLEAQKSELINEHAKQRALQLIEHESNLKDHKSTLKAKVSQNRFNVVISESLYLICTIFNCIFAFRSVSQTKESTRQNSETDPTPDDSEEKEIQNQIDAEEMENDLGEDLSNIYTVTHNDSKEQAENSLSSSVTKIVSKKMVALQPVYDLRKCDSCQEPFIVNTAKEPIAEKLKKKYCCKACLDAVRKEKTYQKRKEEKEEKLQMINEIQPTIFNTQKTN